MAPPRAVVAELPVKVLSVMTAVLESPKPPGELWMAPPPASRVACESAPRDSESERINRAADSVGAVVCEDAVVENESTALDGAPVELRAVVVEMDAVERGRLAVRPEVPRR